jgi:copper chaperone CopZ
MTTSVYAVTGMTCEHCVRSVTEEISTLDGVTSVDVDLSSGKVTVASTKQLGADDVRAAVEEAGYKLTVTNL